MQVPPHTHSHPHPHPHTHTHARTHAHSHTHTHTHTHTQTHISLDMLELGNGEFDADTSDLYEAQARSHYNMWCIMKAVMLLGYESKPEHTLIDFIM